MMMLIVDQHCRSIYDVVAVEIGFDKDIIGYVSRDSAHKIDGIKLNLGYYASKEETDKVFKQICDWVDTGQRGVFKMPASERVSDIKVSIEKFMTSRKNE